MQNITPNFWFDRNAEEAVKMYTAIFPNSRILTNTYYGKEGYEFHQMPEGTILTMDFELCGQSFVALNGGPVFQLNPSISFMVMCDTKEEVQQLWDKLIDGGKALMGLDKYDWSPYYGWLSDKFGVSWQIYQTDQPYSGQKIVPTLMFVGEQCGRAEEAIELYTRIFEDSKVEGILKYGPGDGDQEGLVKHAQFMIRNYVLMAMDSSGPHHFNFNEAVSLIVHCDNQQEVDHYWNALTADGGEESMCGWLKDKFGVSWQIIPRQLYELLGQKDKAKASNATNAMFKMRKIIIADLEAASR